MQVVKVLVLVAFPSNVRSNLFGCKQFFGSSPLEYYPIHVKRALCTIGDLSDRSEYKKWPCIARVPQPKNKTKQNKKKKVV
jgi:hypothetical protein